MAEFARHPCRECGAEHAPNREIRETEYFDGNGDLVGIKTEWRAGDMLCDACAEGRGTVRVVGL